MSSVQPTKFSARYSIRVLDSSRVVQGVVDGYRKFSIVKRFNAVSDWALELDASDDEAANLIVPGNGIAANRTVYDIITGQVKTSYIEIAGPVRTFQRNYQQNTLIVTGKDYLFEVARRQAWPVTFYPYASAVLALPGLLRYYKLSESSGTTATDSKSAQNGTYTGVGVTYGVAPGIDDINTAITLNGTSGRISLPTTSLPTGNSAWTLGAWAKLSSLPSANAYIIGYGANAAGQNPLIYVTSGGLPTGTGFSWGDQAGTAWTTGTWHFVVCTWDGTTLQFYVDGVQAGSGATPGAMTIPGTGLSASIGSNNGGTTSWFPGSIDEAFICSGALSAAAILNLHDVGASRFAYSAHDTSTGAAETVIKHYVSVNLGSSAFSERQISNFSVEADSARGSTVTGNARFDSMILSDGTGLLQQLAVSGGDLGFKMDLSAGALTFKVYTPTDRTASIIFAENMGNIVDFTWERDGPDPESGGNFIVLGGGGQDVERIFTTVEDSTSIADWGRSEFFQDARDTSDITVMQQRGNATLGASAEADQFSVTVQANQQMVYGVDFFLGDKVTTVVDGVAFQEVIREVDITLEGGKGESVTPVVGTINGVLARDASLRLYRKLSGRINQLANLQTRQ